MKESASMEKLPNMHKLNSSFAAHESDFCIFDACRGGFRITSLFVDECTVLLKILVNLFI